ALEELLSALQATKHIPPEARVLTASQIRSILIQQTPGEVSAARHQPAYVTNKSCILLQIGAPADRKLCRYKAFHPTVKHEVRNFRTNRQTERESEVNAFVGTSAVCPSTARLAPLE